jgi:GTP-binding protein HflX
MAEDLLFATLDPTMRAVRLPAVEKAILSDTVGFISDLPTQLVAAFRATLEEVTAADVILHVRDIANPDSDAQKQQVLDVLAELGIIDGEGGEPAIPIIEVWNKWDLLSEARAEQLREVIAHRAEEQIVAISAVTGEGCDDLLEVVGVSLTQGAQLCEFVLPMADGQRIAWLHARGDVLSEQPVDDGEQGPMVRMQVRLTPRELGRFSAL